MKLDIQVIQISACSLITSHTEIIPNQYFMSIYYFISLFSPFHVKFLNILCLVLLIRIFVNRLQLLV